MVQEHTINAEHSAFGAEPCALIPWQNDFLQGLLHFALDASHHDLGNTIILFPHSRPRRYFTELCRHSADLPRPALMPRIYSVSEFLDLFCTAVEQSPRREISLLDRVGVLMDCVRHVKNAAEYGNARPESTLGESLPCEDARLFFPWGLRLSAVLEEFYHQGLAPKDYAYMEGQVVDFAAALLGQLGAIHEEYTRTLDEHGWTSAGYTAFRVHEQLEEDAPFLHGKTIIIAGFYALTGVEKALFTTLRTRYGARVLLHSDPALAEFSAGNPKPRIHWSCREHLELLQEWHTRCELFEEPRTMSDASFKKAKPARPEIDFFEGFDLHSQLDALRAMLSEEQAASAKNSEAPTSESDNSLLDVAGDTAIILPRSELLMPLLHHLPQKNVNVSMGYPLASSPLFRLLDTILSMQEERVERTGQNVGIGSAYAWRSVLDIIRHPYIKMLTVNERRPMPALLQAIEQKVRTGERFCDPRQAEFMDAAKNAAQNAVKTAASEANSAGSVGCADCSCCDGAGITDTADESVSDALALLTQIFRVCISRFERVQTFAELADILEELCTLFVRHGGNLWARFPIDAECLFRLSQRIIPALRENMLAETEFPVPLLCAGLRQLLDAERVPFDAEQLAGTQVLGMLESRLLHFRRVYVVDACEDTLPGTSSYDPLLPNDLRNELHLPTALQREQVAAHNFFRLLQGAEKVSIFYQSGVQAQGLFDEKKQRSRFVEELLWQEEQRRGKLITAGEAPLRAASYTMPPVLFAYEGIARTPDINDAVARYLSKPLSSTALDCYLRCPVQFFYERIAHLRPADEVQEGDDMCGIGNLFHEVLQAFFTPFLRQILTAEMLHKEELFALFDEHLAKSPLSRTLAYDSLCMLRLAGHAKLANFLQNQESGFAVQCLEKEFSSDIIVDGKRIWLGGKIDRADARCAGGLSGAGVDADVILDYKTGNAHKPSDDFWTNDELWQSMKMWTPQEAEETPSTSFSSASSVPNSAPSVLETLSQVLPSVQLPFYLYGYSKASGRKTTNAAYVLLKDNGQEEALFGTSFSDSERDNIITHKIPDLLTFLLRHLTQSRHFMPQVGKHCDWCSAAHLCKKRL